ncbi:hypothetical protein MALU111345_07285 [Marinicrinis lubricantis]
MEMALLLLGTLIALGRLIIAFLEYRMKKK